jgi:glucose-6-phosphate 1-dehydrogenase
MAEDFGIQGRGAFYDGTGAVRDVTVKILKAIDSLAPDDLLRGQFRGYRSEKGVAPSSTVETFAALRLQIASWRWQGVPFYIRAGKCRPVTCTEVVVRLRQPPTMVAAASALIEAGSGIVSIVAHAKEKDLWHE